MNGMPQYPVIFDVDYPDRPLNKLTTFFRIIMIIPILIVMALVGNAWTDTSANNNLDIMAAAGGFLFGGPLVMILFRQKYPQWWFNWNLELMRFSNRINSYFFLLRDEYPSTDDHQAVHLEVPYPNAKTELNRFLPLVKWLLAIPHFIILFFLYIGVFISVVIAWFAILFTGTYPRALFDFVTGVMRWGNRVMAYALILATDKYPPFSLK